MRDPSEMTLSEIVSEIGSISVFGQIPGEGPASGAVVYLVAGPPLARLRDLVAEAARRVYGVVRG